MAPATKFLLSAAWIAPFGLIALLDSPIPNAVFAHSAPSREYRIGWEIDPPFQVAGPDGQPTGLAVELVRLAAQRRGIGLQWVFRPSTSSEDALRRGLVDLWPLLTIIPERARFLHITDPYVQHEHYLIVRAASSFRQPADLWNATVSLVGMPVAQKLVHAILPAARLLPAPSAAETIQQVCRGLADAAFIEEFATTSILLAGSGCSQEPLRIIWAPGLETRLGVGSTFRAADVADEIREEISSMGPDGSLTRLMSEWGYYSPRNLQTTNALIDANRLRRRLIATIAFFASLSLVALFAVWYIGRQRNRIKREIAERELAETAVHESQRRFRDLLERAQLVAIIIDLQSRISFCNDYTLSITGWSRDQIIGQPAAEFLDAPYLRRASEAILDPPAGLSDLPSSENAIRTRDGGLRRIQWSSTVLRDNTGRPSGFASLGEDITELSRLRAEAATRESVERFRAIFQHAAIGVAQIELDGTVALANDKYCSILGFSRDELTGKDFRTFTHPADLERQEDCMRRLLAGEVSSFSMEKRYVRANGSTAWAMLHQSLARDESDVSRYYIVILEDITERKHTEAALRESEERFRNMADTAPVLIWMAGTDKLCTFFNKGWLTFTGRSLEQELGNGWAEGIHREDLDRCMATYISAFDARRPFQMEYRLRSADGSHRWLRDTGVPRFDADGVFAGYIGSCLDITDMKRAYEEATARQKLESLGVLAGGIAHDFNNLLGSIMADAEVVSAELEPGSSPHNGLRRINAVALRAAEIVRELLAYAGRENAVFEPIDLSSVVAEMLELLKVSISKNAVLKVNLPTNLPAVRANTAQLRQVVLNLVSNASEAIGPEAGIITVATSLVRGAPPAPFSLDHLRLEINDTGCGMTADVLARIFDPFFTTKFTGRGLGLAAVQGIVHAHGGGITASSVPGKGTKFEILLPVATGPARKDLPSRTSGQAGSDVSGTVLVVEDEESLRRPVSTMLKRCGFVVIEAGDGLAARQLFEANQGKIDVVLLDLTLPGMPGGELLSEMRRICPDVLVILTTAHSQEKARSEVGGQELWAFIRKPYQLNELVSLIRGACQTRQRSPLRRSGSSE